MKTKSKSITPIDLTAKETRKLNSKFSSFYFNARSVNNKGDSLLLNTALSEHDIIAITETWLSPDHHDREFMDDKYKTFRKDRIFSDIDCENGGGVLIAIKNEIECSVVTTEEMDDLESVCIKIPTDFGVLYVYCLYIQPRAPANTYLDHLRAINSINLSVNDSILIFGDWNFSDTIKWQEHDDSL